MQLAAGQLREAPAQGSCLEIAVHVRAAAMTALQDVFGAFDLSAAYEFADFIESITEERGSNKAAK